MKKPNLIGFLIVLSICLILFGSMIYKAISITANGYNKQIIDITYNYDYAQIGMPDGTVVSGKVDSWTDFEDGDQIQVCIDGKIYLTDTTRCVLWSD